VRERGAQTLEWAHQVKAALLTIALDHLSLGRAHLLAAQRGTGGDLAQATTHLTQAVDGLRRAGHQDYLPLGLLARAALHLHNGALDRAHKDLAEALSLAQRCGLRLHLAGAHLAYGRLHLAEGRTELARRALEAAGGIVTATGYHRRDGELAELSEACAREEEKERKDAKTQGRKKTERGEGETSVSSFCAFAPLRLCVPSPDPETTSPPPSPAPSIAMPLLSLEDLHALHAAAVGARLAESRATLLAGIDAVFIASLPVRSSPSEQVLSDLDALSQTGALADGSVPLLAWLQNAAHLAGAQVQATVFARAHAEITARRPPS